MSLLATLPQAILDTILGRLALLFLPGACGDHAAARHAAKQMLAAYNPQTEAEFSLAADIISFGFHALEALSQSAEPGLKLAAILRLRGSAISLSREAHKSQRKLDQLQRERRAGKTQQPAETPAAEPEAISNRPGVDTALELIECARDAIRSARKRGGKTWTQQFQQRQTAKRIAENLRKKQAEHADLAAHLASTGAGTQAVCAIG
jgi:hypothetical protein